MATSDTPRSPQRRPIRSSRVSPKGQVTVPKPVRDHLGLDPGTSVEFELTGEGTVVLRKQPESARPLRGILRDYAHDPALTLEELDDTLGQEVSRLDAQSRNRTGGAVDAGAVDAETDDVKSEDLERGDEQA
jgi:AbrB family looped-hinge helix DNA binding protein